MDNMEDDPFDSDEPQSGRKKKKGDSASSGILTVSDIAVDDMRQRGFSLNQIKDILKNWKRLSPKEIALRFAEFGKDMTRASVHIVVSFAKNSNFAVVTDFLKMAHNAASLFKKMSKEGRRLATKDGRQPMKKTRDTGPGNKIQGQTHKPGS